ncbi:MAG TPA: geranylgeranyl reductase family protein, partial [Actinomycetota bacterium]|nr:geranylgeranyl reductase family protein [Actinomycetota bacterium]
MPPHDLIVAGAGPAGSAAAWRAASAGARVVVVDKAVFPRDKPCGDGLTPRAVRSIEQIGLGNELKRFHRVDTLRVFGAGKVLEFPWPASETFPQYGYVAARTDLDDMMLRHAQVAGAEVLEGTTVLGPVVEDGIVSGVRVRDSSGEREMRASAVIAADGASSAIGRALGMVRSPASPMGVAIRAHFPSSRPEDTAIESHLEVREAGTTLPGYGWVFPMGNGRINVGTGLLSTYPDWRRVNTAHLLAA